jgi:choline-sulfatase
MNVLWIMADQMRADFCGFMGNAQVQTPNLDRLAARGTVFENTFAQAPICTPSRTSIFTSRYVHAHGAWWNGIAPSRPRTLLPDVFREAGYATGLVGKLHINPTDADHGFDHIEQHEECLPFDESAYQQLLKAQSPPVQTPFDNTDWSNRAAECGICEMPEELEETRWVADRACAYLDARREEPFFLFASFVRPHSPYNPLRRFLDMYKDVTFDAPDFDPGEWERIPPRVREVAKSWGWDQLTATEFAEIRRHYAALCTQVDENVGRILDRLAASGLADDTVVVFAADHGDFVGEHGMLYKEHLWDGSLHVPLVVHDPRRQANRCTGLVEAIDIAPTVLELSGTDVPASMQGKSLVPVLDDPALSHRDAVFAEFEEYTVNTGVHDVLRACPETRMFSVRTGRYKYIHYVGEDGELYDVHADPRERKNLIRDPAYSDVVGDLRLRLLDWQVATKDHTPAESDNVYFSTYFGATENRTAYDAAGGEATS